MEGPIPSPQSYWHGAWTSATTLIPRIMRMRWLNLFRGTQTARAALCLTNCKLLIRHAYGPTKRRGFRSRSTYYFISSGGVIMPVLDLLVEFIGNRCLSVGISSLSVCFPISVRNLLKRLRRQMFSVTWAFPNRTNTSSR